MESIRELYRTGPGPSSSHTMAPRAAALRFRALAPGAARYRVTLYGSLAATGRGHLTDVALREALAPAPLEIVWRSGEEIAPHPLGMLFEALDENGGAGLARRFFSVGGGAILEEGAVRESRAVYECRKLSEVLALCEQSGMTFWEYVFAREGAGIAEFLETIWDSMGRAISRGLSAEGALPGPLGLARKAKAIYRKTRMAGPHYLRTGLLSSYALAAAEENAAGGEVVTAPTCGSCGVLPATLRYTQETVGCETADVIRALATAGLIGNFIKHNASISGAEVGCQGEIGAACAMAAAAAAQLLGGTIRQIEYAAEMGLEHHLGLTCDPVAGLVQIPCIERNAHAATRAMTCADYALFTDGAHRIPFDETVAVMSQTGHDLPALYRETASGGLAAAYDHRP